jgi:hypothetical protein
MKIQILQEITDWGDTPVANGKYHLNENGHLVAYERTDGVMKTFRSPMKQFSKARRKFKTIGEYTL